MRGLTTISSTLAALSLFSNGGAASAEPWLPEPYLSLADSARAAPPELAADALIRIAAAPKLLAPLRIELLDGAFQIAGAATFPIRLNNTGLHTDTREWAVTEALALGLDRLSLRGRVVQAMLPLSPRRGREMFETLNPFPLARLSCADTLYPSLAHYYATAKLVLETGYSAAERKEEEDFLWAQGHVRAMNSALQIEPIAEILLLPRWNAKQFANLYSGFAAAVKQLDADPLSFSRGNNFAAQQRLDELSRKALQHDVSRTPFADAWATFLARPSHRVECGKRKVENMEIAGTVYEYWEKPDTRSLLMGLKRLRFGSGDKKISEEDRKEKAWEDGWRDFLNEFERWQKHNDETEADYFHESAMIYNTLLELTPAGNNRNRVTALFISFLKTSNMQLTSPPEWLFELRRLLRTRDVPPEDRKLLAEEVGHSGNALMALYADLERLLPAP